jgi:hypothetical protein
MEALVAAREGAAEVEVIQGKLNQHGSSKARGIDPLSDGSQRLHVQRPGASPIAAQPLRGARGVQSPTW